MELSGNTALITGGTSGIGYAMAEAFLAAGSRVLICDRDETRLRKTAGVHPQFHTRLCDVSRDADRHGLLQWVTSEFPELNVFVNNAGIQRDIDLTRGTEQFEAGENEIRVNLEAPILLTGLFAPVLARNRGATFINVSSGLGFAPMADMPVYCATKAGMHAFCLAMRVQLDRVGIDVVEVIPPPVDTHLNPQGRAKRGSYKPELSARDFVASVMRQLAQDHEEIGFGMTADFPHAGRTQLDQAFRRMNGLPLDHRHPA